MRPESKSRIFWYVIVLVIWVAFKVWRRAINPGETLLGNIIQETVFPFLLMIILVVIDLFRKHNVKESKPENRK